MGGWINFNGRLLTAETPVFTAESRAARYGDGIFETMRIEDNTLMLASYHFERFFSGLQLLNIRLSGQVTRHFLEEEITRTVVKNKLDGAVRVRLSAFRGEGGLYETEGPGKGYLIQVWPLLPRKLNENGLVMGAFHGATKSCGALSNVKSSNYLVYVLAALHAKERGYNECAVLNQHGRVCDATIANIFWVEKHNVFTPPLDEGCVAGVMRRHLVGTLPAKGFRVTETPTDILRLQEADEIFLTNAISGIRWVGEFNGKKLTNTCSLEIFRATF